MLLLINGISVYSKSSNFTIVVHNDFLFFQSGNTGYYKTFFFLIFFTDLQSKCLQYNEYVELECFIVICCFYN